MLAKASLFPIAGVSHGDREKGEREGDARLLGNSVTRSWVGEAPFLVTG